jgi:hypothetical protein
MGISRLSGDSNQQRADIRAPEKIQKRARQLLESVPQILAMDELSFLHPTFEVTARKLDFAMKIREHESL